VRRGTDIDHAARVLGDGGLVAFPTETVYGLGADAASPTAVRKIFAAKRRPAGHPLIVHLAPGADLDAWAVDVPGAARALAARFWPGPLTIILRRGPAIAPEVTGGGATVGLRTPAHPVAQALLAAFGGAIAAPSANRHGQVSPTTADHVVADLGDDVDYVLDGGPCEVGVESTIVDLSGGAAALLRPGAIAAADLERALGAPLTPPGDAAPRAPGTLPSHYAPRARVIAVDPADLASAIAAAAPADRVAALGLAAALDAAALPDGVVRAALPDDLDAAARGLYAALRELDASGVDVIVAALPAEHGVGAAIADRLRRAAGPR
jgi:L-threonylcarbamoyladenylate synthase